MFHGVGSKHASQSQYGKVAQDSHPCTSEHFEQQTVSISQQDGKTTIVAKSLVVDIVQDPEAGHKKKHKAKHGHHDASSVKVASVAQKRKFDGGQVVDKSIEDDQGSEAKKQKVHLSNGSKIKDSKIAVDEHEKLRTLSFDKKRDKALEICQEWGWKFIGSLSFFSKPGYMVRGLSFKSELEASKNWDSLIKVFENNLKLFQAESFSGETKKLVDELEPMLKKFKKEYGPKA